MFKYFMNEIINNNIGNNIPSEDVWDIFDSFDDKDMSLDKNDMDRKCISCGSDKLITNIVIN